MYGLTLEEQAVEDQADALLKAAGRDKEYPALTTYALRRKKRLESPFCEDLARAASEIANVERLMALDQAIREAGLEPEERTALVVGTLLPHSLIGLALGVAERTAERRLQKARQKLAAAQAQRNGVFGAVLAGA